jgi:hypothetical protein
MTQVKVKDLQVGDRVIASNGKPVRITGIGKWGRGSVCLSLYGMDSCVMRKSDTVEKVEPKPKPTQEPTP